ncbi:MAG: magnesium transporter [Bullifex sp.]
MKEIRELLKGTLTPRAVQEKLMKYHESEIAEALSLLTKEERTELYRILTPERLAEVLEYTDDRGKYLEELSLNTRLEILDHLDTPEVTEYLRCLSPAERETMLSMMDDTLRIEVAYSSSFSSDQIGSRMTSDYVSVTEGTSVKNAMKHVIAAAAECDNISDIFVTDGRGRLSGAVSLKDLVKAREDTPLSAITMTGYPFVRAENDIGTLGEFREDTIPVVDCEGRLRGVITSQEITQIVGDEFGEDYARLAGLASEEEHDETVLQSVRKRLPWLVILLGLGMVVSSVVGAFEHVVAHLSVIVSFQSLILDMAGNAGTQSLAVTIRVLMDENLSRKSKVQFVLKEARIGITNGVSLAILSFIPVVMFLSLMKAYPWTSAMLFATCTSLALLASVTLSGAVGTVVPMMFRKLGIDPAVASGPLITTVNDLVAIVIYYGLAWILLINMAGL